MSRVPEIISSSTLFVVRVTIRNVRLALRISMKLHVSTCNQVHWHSRRSKQLSLPPSPFLLPSPSLSLSHSRRLKNLTDLISLLFKLSFIESRSNFFRSVNVPLPPSLSFDSRPRIKAQLVVEASHDPESSSSSSSSSNTGRRNAREVTRSNERNRGEGEGEPVWIPVFPMWRA